MKSWYQFVILTDFWVWDCFGPSVSQSCKSILFPTTSSSTSPLSSLINPEFWFDCCLFCTCSMILMNYLNEMSHNDKSELVGVMAVSIPWNCMESCVSLEQPINSFLFNKHLTRNLVNMLNRYLTVIYNFRPALNKVILTNPPAPPSEKKILTVLLQSAFPQKFSMENSLVVRKVKDRF